MNPTPQEARLTLFGRTMFEQAGVTDDDARATIEQLRKLRTAKRVKVFQYEGTVVLGPEQDDNESQLRACEQWTKLFDWLPNRMEHALTGDVKFTVLGLDQERV